MFDRFENRLVLGGTLTAETALRIGAGKSTEVVGTDLPVLRDALGQPFIPGSSFKGAFRARVEAFVRAVADDRRQACYPTDGGQWCIRADEMKAIKDEARGKGWSDAEFSDRVLGHTCLVCQLFGSPWLASHVQIRDLPVSSVWIGQYQVRNGVAIDRDTETASEGLLYDYEVVPAGTAFDCQILVENAKEWQLGMLFVGLQEFADGRVALGGGRSRGLGAVRLDLTEKTLVEGQDLLAYLAGDGGRLVKDEDIKKWRGEFIARLRKEASHAQKAG